MEVEIDDQRQTQEQDGFSQSRGLKRKTQQNTIVVDSMFTFLAGDRYRSKDKELTRCLR